MNLIKKIIDNFKLLMELKSELDKIDNRIKKIEQAAPLVSDYPISNVYTNVYPPMKINIMGEMKDNPLICKCEYPDNYHSSDGMVPCMKCGKRAFIGPLVTLS